MTSWSGNSIKRSDVEVAKNYLDEKELDALNKIVAAYLDIAEVHALNQEPMYMKDWLISRYHAVYAQKKVMLRIF